MLSLPGSGEDLCAEVKAGWLWQDSELLTEDTAGTGGMKAASPPASGTDTVIGVCRATQRVAVESCRKELSTAAHTQIQRLLGSPGRTGML